MKYLKQFFIVVLLICIGIGFPYHKVQAEQLSTANDIASITTPSTSTTLPLLIIYPGIDNAGYPNTQNGNVWITGQIPESIQNSYLIVVPTKHNTSFSSVKKEWESFTKEHNITISKKIILGFSGGGIIAGQEASSEYLLVGLIDPSTNGDLINKQYGANTKMIYNANNWGGFPTIKSLLPQLETKINKDGGKAEALTLQHLEMPQHFFKNLMPDVSALSNTTNSGNTSSVNSKKVEDFLVSNPTKELERGVINAGGLPSIGDSATGQIANQQGIAAGQSIISFVIKTMLKFIGLASLIGLLYNAFMIVSHGYNDDKRPEYIRGVLWSIGGLVIALVSHAIVTAIVQFLNQGDSLF